MSCEDWDEDLALEPRLVFFVDDDRSNGDPVVAVPSAIAPILFCSSTAMADCAASCELRRFVGRV